MHYSVSGSPVMFWQLVQDVHHHKCQWATTPPTQTGDHGPRSKLYSYSIRSFYCPKGEKRTWCNGAGWSYFSPFKSFKSRVRGMRYAFHKSKQQVIVVTCRLRNENLHIKSPTKLIHKDIKKEEISCREFYSSFFIFYSASGLFIFLKRAN